MIGRPRNVDREVWQYGQGQMPSWVAHSTEWHHAQGETPELYLVRRSGKQRLEAGDWLVRDLDGDPEWMDDRDFQAAYEIVKP